MAEEHGVAGGPNHHTDHGQPDVTHSFWWVSTISYTQHMTHGHKQGVGVLHVPSRILLQKKVVMLCSSVFLLLPRYLLTYMNVLVMFTHHHVIFGHPAVWGKVLQHWHHESQAAIPVAQQQHHSNQVDYTHNSTGQVIGHVEDLMKLYKEIITYVQF